jgi:tetratricopeptide (TPR) repeat protein
LGAAYLHSGRLPEALSILKEALQTGASMKLMLFRPLLLGFMGEAYLLTGQLDEARQYVEGALALSKERRERGWEAWSLKLIGQLASHPDFLDYRRAEEAYFSALVIAAEIRMRPLEAHCRLGLGQLFGKSGDAKQAREHLDNAAHMFREMDMPFWLEKAEETLKTV